MFEHGRQPTPGACPACASTDLRLELRDADAPPLPPLTAYGDWVRCGECNRQWTILAAHPTRQRYLIAVGADTVRELDLDANTYHVPQALDEVDFTGWQVWTGDPWPIIVRIADCDDRLARFTWGPDEVLPTSSDVEDDAHA